MIRLSLKNTQICHAHIHVSRQARRCRVYIYRNLIVSETNFSVDRIVETIVIGLRQICGQDSPLVETVISYRLD